MQRLGDASLGHAARRRRPPAPTTAPTPPAPTPTTDGRRRPPPRRPAPTTRRRRHDAGAGRRPTSAPSRSSSPRSRGSTEPIDVADPAGRRPTLYIAEQGGRSASASATAQLDAEPVLDISADDRGRRRAGPARPGLLARRQPALRRLHRPRRRHPRRRVRGRRRRHGRRRPAAARCCSRTSRSPTTTAANSSSAPTATSTSASATAARPATRSATARTSARGSARSCASIPTPTGDQPYTVPADNPFVGQAGAKPEIWTYGLRNPWRFSFDAATGDLWIGDVGQDDDRGGRPRRPAADGAGKGVNFGWSAFEGTTPLQRRPAGRRRRRCRSSSTTHGDGGCSITGGYVYRGPAIPALRGAYVFGDYCVGGVRAIDAGQRRRQAGGDAVLLRPVAGRRCRASARATGRRAVRPVASAGGAVVPHRPGLNCPRERASAAGAHEHDLEGVVVLDAVTGAEHDALERRRRPGARAPSSPARCGCRGRAAGRRRRRGGCPASGSPAPARAAPWPGSG